MNILLIHPQKEVGELLSFPLESKFSASVFFAANLDQGRDYLLAKKIVPDLVVAHNAKETVEPLAALLKEAALAPNLVLCDGTHVSGATFPGTTLWGIAGKENLLADLEALIQKNRGEQKVEKPGDDDKFCRINTSLLLKMNPLAADIYIRLSATHYIKMFQKDDTFDEKDLERYRNQKKVDYLYLPNADCPVFVNKLSAELAQMLASRTPPPPKTLNETVSSALETTHELIAKFGVTEEVQKVMKDSVALTMKSMGDFPQLGDILKNIKNHGGKYIGHHSMLLGNIACSLAVCMDWISDSTFEKLTLAAFLHDAPIRNHELCAVKTLDEFDKKYKGEVLAGPGAGI